MAEGFLIRTPTDFEQTIGGMHSYSKVPLVSPPPEIEPQFRRALDDIFEDLPYIDSSEPGLVSSYLNSIEDPLRTLHELGFSLFALVTRSTLTLPDSPLGSPSQRQIPNWRQINYLVVPLNGFFRLGMDTQETVHTFSPQCQLAVATLAKATQKQMPVIVWGSATIVRAELEGKVPWCQECCLEQAIQA